jgi:hypothetical protein
MTDVAAPARSARALAFWLVPLGILTLLAIGVLWAIPRPAAACIAISPPPPECAGGDTSVVVPFLVLLVLLDAAIVACGLLVPVARRRLVLGILAGVLGLVFLVGLAATLSAAAPPPVISS